MSATAEARQLTEAHRLAQTQIGARTIRQMFAAFRILDPADLDGSVTDWLRVAVPIVQEQRKVSAALAGQYLTRYRAFEIGADAGFAPVIEGPASIEALTTSLQVTGPIRMKIAAANGRPLVEAVGNARVSTARAAQRHALDGGRGTIERTTQADRKALGFARATSGSPCAFCALLASRGPVYAKKTAGFESHDGCSCTAEPVYSRDGAWPAGSRQFAEIYQQAKNAEGSTSTAFRQLIESPAPAG